jgi:hypothetical protein
MCRRHPPDTRPDSGPPAAPSARLLTLVGAIRRLAYDWSLTPDDAMRRICDAFADYDGGSHADVQVRASIN